MILFLTLAAVVNISIGYVLAGLFSPALADSATLPFFPLKDWLRGESAEGSDELDADASDSTEETQESESTASSPAEIDAANAPAKSPSADTSRQSKETATATVILEAPPNSCEEELEQICNKLAGLRNFQDKSIGESLSSDLRGIVQSHFDAWEEDAMSEDSPPASDDDMQKLALTETIISNLAIVDWEDDVDAAIKFIEKQLDMFKQCM